MEKRTRRRLLVLLFWLVGLGLVFAVYCRGITTNPPGFYMDESAPAYNGYLVAHTGAGEFGPRFPLYFQYYTDTWTQIGGPVQVYLYALLFRFLPPSILLARLYSAFWVFFSGIVLGVLATRITGRRTVGFIVAGTALVTPWFFESRGLLLEPQLLPTALAPLLLAVYHVQKKDRWSLLDVVMIAAALALVTYCYTSGRVLGPLLGLGLLLFATTPQRFFGVVKVGVFYALTLVPILVYNSRNPGVLTKRLNEISYIRPGVPLRDVFSQFIQRYLEDQGLYSLLMVGDLYPRHHVPGSGGAIFFATFILIVIGLAIVLARSWTSPWWRYVLYGLAISIVPGAMSQWAFHSMRLMAYPVFLIVLTIPAVDWLLGRSKPEPLLASSSGATAPENEVSENLSRGTAVPRGVRILILLALLVMMGVETYRFQKVYSREGPKRTFHFDIGYKAAYDAALNQPERPIYLEDGKWGPAYIHAMWYATIEKRPKSEFVHLRGQDKAPPGKVVISTNDSCDQCATIARIGVFHVFKTL